MLASVFFVLFKRKLSVRIMLIFSVLVLLNLASSIYFNGISFLPNAALYYLFLSPLFLYAALKQDDNRPMSPSLLKRIIEHYIIIQVGFSTLAIMYGLSLGKTLDVAFGDIIAGTFRMPLTRRSDASNVIFVFSMILNLFFYVRLAKIKINYFIFLSGALVAFFASVNHLVIAGLTSIAISYALAGGKRTLYYFGTFLAIVLSSVLLYRTFQPANFQLIFKQVLIAAEVADDLDNLSSTGFKGAYFANVIHDFFHNPAPFLFFGIGAGTYSSRAALFFTGEYVNGFAWRNISEFLANNTYPLWLALKQAPPWRSGAFNYPYAAVTSMVAELGLLFTSTLAVFFFRRLWKSRLFKLQDVLFLATFLLLAGMVDNYFEYFQAMAIFLFLTVLSERASQPNLVSKTNAVATQRD